MCTRNMADPTFHAIDLPKSLHHVRFAALLSSLSAIQNTAEINWTFASEGLSQLNMQNFRIKLKISLQLTLFNCGFGLLMANVVGDSCQNSQNSRRGRRYDELARMSTAPQIKKDHSNCQFTFSESPHGFMTPRSCLLTLYRKSLLIELKKK